MRISPSAPALTLVLTFTVVFPFFEIDCSASIWVSGSCLGLSGARYLFKVGSPVPSPGCGPALIPVLTFSPRAMVWLWFIPQPHSGQPGSPTPAFTFVLTFKPRAIVWLWLGGRVAVEPMMISPVLAPAFTFVLIFIDIFPFFENRC